MMAGIISRIVGYFAPDVTAQKPKPEPQQSPKADDSSSEKPESKSPESSEDQTVTNTTGVLEGTNESECMPSLHQVEFPEPHMSRE